MNVQEGLQQIREMLVDNEANPKTLKLVDGIAQRAALPAAASATAGSLLQLVRMLMRNSQTASNPVMYNDLVKVEAELEERANEHRERREAEEARPTPKLKKYYKKKK